MLMIDLVKKTETLFDGTELKLPEPPVIWKDRLVALEEANLVKQRASCIFDMRCWQAESLGFEKVDLKDIAYNLMSEKPTSDWEDRGERQKYEYVYNHHVDQELIGEKCTWGSVPIQLCCLTKKGFWHCPPFAKVEKWRVQFGKLDYLKRDFPYGVVLKMAELKKLKLFNAFNVMAPMEAWIQPTSIDPIVFASIWEMPPNESGEYRSAGKTNHYFVAQW